MPAYDRLLLAAAGGDMHAHCKQSHEMMAASDRSMTHSDTCTLSEFIKPKPMAVLKPMKSSEHNDCSGSWEAPVHCKTAKTCQVRIIVHTLLHTVRVSVDSAWYLTHVASKVQKRTANGTNAERFLLFLFLAFPTQGQTRCRSPGTHSMRSCTLAPDGRT